MSLTDPYVTVDQLKAWMSGGADLSSYDAVLTKALASAKDEVDKFTKRQFNDAGSVSLRKFHAISPSLAIVDDFHTSAGLILTTDDDDDGSYETTWSASDYQLEPLDGIHDGAPGWPFWRIRAVGDKTFPMDRRAGIGLTARWGWASVPEPVYQATQILAAESFSLKDAPLGVVGMAEFGVIRVKDSRMAAMKLAPFARNKVLVA